MFFFCSVGKRLSAFSNDPSLRAEGVDKLRSLLRELGDEESKSAMRWDSMLNEGDVKD